ncbi:MAG: EAL domain-containing protein (putative c-di-GMP-specific phosphodiesterase class I)/ActR [Oleiphilaceae bacterium]|jgi:EAL domain-containing protein (putative c-di-GMP-specific phosphodiesterase class I)/ActR/RegA family two-component response regulator
METKSVFVVDDEVDFVTFVVNVAKSLGFNVKSSSDPSELIKSRLIDFDIIVLDLFMPTFDGIELLRFLADNRSRASIILMSGKDKSVLRSAQELAVERGMTVLGVLQKPFRAHELASLLSGYVNPLDSNNIVGISEHPDLEELRKAINNEQLYLVFQPQINIMSRKVVGVEALVRWEHPLKGMIPPSYFIPLAEKHNLISSITEYVTKTAIQQLAEWHRQGFKLRLSINISPQTLVDFDMPEKLETYVVKMGLETSDVVIEVTETALMLDIISYIDILTRFRMKGFCLSIDDFGTGYSSLQQLVRVPFTELKIDLAFIQKLAVDRECKTIAEISILLAHKLNMTVVAEGIEDETTWNILKELGCDEGQGYWMGMPMIASKIPKWIVNWSKK